jgi:hypothetical protein
MWKKFHCPMCWEQIGLLFLYKNRKNYMIKCPNCERDFRFMWSTNQRSPENMTTASIIENLLMKRVIFYCIVSLPPVIVMITYLLLIFKGGFHG